MVLHMLISPIAVGRRHACHATWAFRHVGASYMHITCMQLRHALLHAPKGSFGCCVPRVCYEALISLRRRGMPNMQQYKLLTDGLV